MIDSGWRSNLSLSDVRRNDRRFSSKLHWINGIKVFFEFSFVTPRRKAIMRQKILQNSYFLSNLSTQVLCGAVLTINLQIFVLMIDIFGQFLQIFYRFRRNCVELMESKCFLNFHSSHHVGKL